MAGKKRAAKSRSDRMLKSAPEAPEEGLSARAEPLEIVEVKPVCVRCGSRELRFSSSRVEPHMDVRVRYYKCRKCGCYTTVRARVVFADGGSARSPGD